MIHNWIYGSSRGEIDFPVKKGPTYMRKKLSWAILKFFSYLGANLLVPFFDGYLKFRGGCVLQCSIYGS